MRHTQQQGLAPVLTARGAGRGCMAARCFNVNGKFYTRAPPGRRSFGLYVRMRFASVQLGTISLLVYAFERARTA